MCALENQPLKLSLTASYSIGGRGFPAAFSADMPPITGPLPISARLGASPRKPDTVSISFNRLALAAAAKPKQPPGKRTPSGRTPLPHPKQAPPVLSPEEARASEAQGAMAAPIPDPVEAPVSPIEGAAGVVAAAAVAGSAVAAGQSEPELPPASTPVVDDLKVQNDTVPREALLSIETVSKSFGKLRANDAVSLKLYPGEKHALLGENGAGKSTLVKMIYGVLQPDSGRLVLDGKPARITSPAMARTLGIGMVFQHFSTFEALTVAENLAVVLPDRSLSGIRKDVAAISKEYGLAIEPRRQLSTLSAGERQRVEIIRCLLQNPRLLIMDEPTSVLTPQEAEALFKTLDRLADDGCAILYISHRLEEVRGLCDTATVLRRGKVVATCDPRKETASSLAEMMVGSVIERPKKIPAYVGSARLEVAGLSVAATGGQALHDVTFSARKGEILGIAGVAGEGQSELFAALSGETPVRKHDAIMIDGEPIGRFSVTRRRRLGMAFAPERRLGHSAIADMRLSENYHLTHNALGKTDSSAREVREAFDVRAEGSDPFAGALSGGNLQKFVIGREIVRKPGVFVVAQPTWGVDAGAAAAIHAALLELSKDGAAVVVISQDLDEIFAICDRVAVLHRGSLSEPQVASAVTAESLGLLMGGSDANVVSLAEAGA